MGIVSRDIKPENILVKKDYSAVLIDFNLACVYAPRSDLECRQPAGSPLYSAPELSLDTDKPINWYKCDIYSLGVTLFYLFNDTDLPFEPESGDMELFFHQKLETDPVPSRSGNKEVDRLIMQ